MFPPFSLNRRERHCLDMIMMIAGSLFHALMCPASTPPSTSLLRDSNHCLDSLNLYAHCTALTGLKGCKFLPQQRTHFHHCMTGKKAGICSDSSPHSIVADCTPPLLQNNCRKHRVSQALVVLRREKQKIQSHKVLYALRRKHLQWDACHVLGVSLWIIKQDSGSGSRR